MGKLIFFLFCLVVHCLATPEMCSNKKIDKKCYCKRTTDKDRITPVTMADCTGIGLTSVPKSETLDAELSDLDVSFNNIENLNSKNAFSSLVLRRFVLSHNNITNIDGIFFNSTPNLHYLDLSYNYITGLEVSVFKPLVKLRKLDLSYNKISRFPVGMLSASTHLISLDVSYNPVGQFLLDFPLMLHDVLGLNQQLTDISLNHVGLHQLPNNFFDGYTNLTHVSLTDNNLIIIPSLPQSIEYLDLSGNKFTFVSAAYLNYKSLKTLKLNRMPSLTEIHHYAFFNLKHLKRLHIADCNNLKEFNELAFGLTYHNELKLKSIVLARNGLTRLNESYSRFFDVMEHVDLSDNPWDCDCGILWLLRYKENNASIYHKKNIRCFTPDDLSGRPVMSLEDKELPQCFPGKFGKTAHPVAIPVLILAVIVLLLLILYLVKYAPRWYGSSRNVGPNSPYNIATDID